MRAFLKGLKRTVASPAAAIAMVLKHNDALKKQLEVERLAMVIRDNIVTPEVRANGYGGIDRARFARAIDQLALDLQVQGGQAEAGRYFRRRPICRRRPSAKSSSHHLSFPGTS